MMAFGFLGFFMKKNGYSSVSLILGLTLGPMAETSLQQALLISRGSFSFLISPLSLFILFLSVLSLGKSLSFDRNNPCNED